MTLSGKQWTLNWQNHPGTPVLDPCVEAISP